MKNAPNKITKRELRQELHLTVPPRLEGAVKEAMMRTVRKLVESHVEALQPHKPQGYTAAQRKNYQLGDR